MSNENRGPVSTPATDQRSRRRWLVPALVAALALGAAGVVLAATGHVVAYGLISLYSNDAFDGIQLTTVPPATHQNLVYANYDVQYDLTGWHTWESATWTSPAGQHYPASIIGTDWSTTDLVEGRYIQLRNLTVDHTDLDAQNVQLKFIPVTGNTSLTLNEGSLTSLNIPLFKGDSVLTLNASGNSSIKGWTGPVESSTLLNVLPGGTLTFDRDGNMSQQSVTSSLYFRHPLGNTATIDGGTLRLLTSWVTFGSRSVDPAHLSNMTFANGAVLELAGDQSILEADNFDFASAAVRVGMHRLTSRATVKLNTATVELAEGGKFTSEVLDVFGTNTVTLPAEAKPTTYNLSTGLALLEPNSSLTLAGEGRMAVTLQLLFGAAGPGQQYGQVVVNGKATLVSSGALFDVVPPAPITINRTSDSVYGSLLVRDGGTLSLRASAGSPNHLTNHGWIGVENGFLEALGPVTIQGGTEGSLDVESDGEIRIGSKGSPLAATQSLTTGNDVNMWEFSTLAIALDPAARTCGQLRTTGNFLLGSLTNLNLSLANDSAVPLGTKFTLVDYGTLKGISVPGQWHFNGYPNGSTFKLGQTWYRINYKDVGEAGYNGAITLTVVAAPPAPASLSPASQVVNGTVGVALTPSATMVPTGFVGAVTYAISPALPAGLRFDLVTGVVSGFPTAASASATYTIRATGSTSGDATATVTLAIAKGSQAITFGPAPAPTFASGGGFVVSASATSGLPVSFSSLTPAVCTAGGGNTVAMLSAGLCTIVANQAGDANYGAAPPVNQAITIAKASPLPLTLTSNPNTFASGGTASLSTAGGSGTGAITFHVTSGPCAVTPPSTLTGTDGSCTVEARQAADANYTAGTSNPVIVNVGPGTQGKLVLTATPTSFGVNGTSVLSTTGGDGPGTVTYAVTSGPCTMLNATTVRGTAEGKCQVVATKAAGGGFGPATSLPVTLTVNLLVPPALVLTATPASVGFGGSSTLGTTGGISGGAVSYIVTGPCSVSGNTLVGTGSGVCVVTATQAETSVYGAATSSPVTVTVKERTTAFAYPQGIARIGQPFVLTPVTGGFTRPTFAVLYGNLPAGLNLDPATGVISGTPVGPVGTFDAVITAYENNAYDAALAVVDVQASTEVPTLSEMGLAILALGLALAGMRFVRGGA